MGHILYLMFRIILSIFKKNKIENKITFKIKTGYYLKLIMPETMKLLGSSENKTTEEKNGVNVPYFEIAEVVSSHN